MHVWILFGVLLVAGLALLLLDTAQLRKSLKMARMFSLLLQVPDRKPGGYRHWLDLARSRLFQPDSEFRTLLVQAELDSRFGVFIWVLIARIWPAIAAILVFSAMTVAGYGMAHRLMAGLFMFSFFFVGANMALRWRAASITGKIGKELVPFLHMLRMLFNAGLSLEHTLVTLVEESGQLFPHLHRQLKRVVANAGGGQDQAEALVQMARMLRVQEVTDTMAMLYQVSRHGGNVQASLAQYIQLIEERQLLAAREYISKLSAKMSVVMMVFMFPALIVFIAGPGFIGLSNALSRSQF